LGIEHTSSLGYDFGVGQAAIEEEENAPVHDVDEKRREQRR